MTWNKLFRSIVLLSIFLLIVPGGCGKKDDKKGKASSGDGATGAAGLSGAPLTVRAKNLGKVILYGMPIQLIPENCCDLEPVLEVSVRSSKNTILESNLVDKILYLEEKIPKIYDASRWNLLNQNRRYLAYGCSKKDLKEIKQAGYLDYRRRKSVSKEEYKTLRKSGKYLAFNTVIFCGSNILKAPLRVKADRFILKDSHLKLKSGNTSSENFILTEKFTLMGSSKIHLIDGDFSSKTLPESESKIVISVSLKIEVQDDSYLDIISQIGKRKTKTD